MSASLPAALLEPRGLGHGILPPCWRSPIDDARNGFDELTTRVTPTMDGATGDVLPTTVRPSLRSQISSPVTLDFAAFVVPATSFVQVTIVGRIILSEILALALLPWLLRSRDRLRPPRWLLFLLAAWFVSQVITDIAVGSAAGDLARGWAAIIFTGINLLAILTLAATPRRARIFAFGIAAGGVLGYFFNATVFVTSDPWKFAIAGAVGITLAALLSGEWATRKPWVPIAAFGAFGVFNALIGFRSMSGVALMTAAYLLLSAILARGRWPLWLSPPRALAGMGLFAATALAVYVGLSGAAASNLLGDAAKAKFDAQAGVVEESRQPTAPASAIPGASSDVVIVSPGAGASGVPASSPVPANPIGVLAGGRAELLPSTQAILDSPILGHGSWARGPQYVELQRQWLIQMGIPGGNLPGDPTLIPTHSYLLGSWVWAGLAGGMFWFVIAVAVLWLLGSLYRLRFSLKPLVIFVGSLLLWSIAFSPYSNTERLYAMFAITLCLLGARLAGLRTDPVDRRIEFSSP